MSYAMEYIEQHGRANVWCTPTQDTQYMIKPKRLTKPVGAVRKFSLLGQRYSLPTATGTYHVFMFGQVPASFFNIMDGQSLWRKASTICRQNDILIDIYLDNGIQFPRHDTWFLILPDKNIVVAVKDQPRIPFSLVSHAPAVRFYSNAFFKSERRLDAIALPSNPATTKTVNWEIYVHGKTIATQQDISDMSTLFTTQYAKPGFAYGIVNGYKVSVLNALTMAIGDVVEIVHDSTISWAIDIPFSELGSFHSTLDSKSKYLLTFMSGLNTLWRDATTNQTMFEEKGIFYKDDVDIFLYKTLPGGIKKGVVYHRNQVDGVRMLTHKDYSIPTTYLQGYIGTTNLFTNTDGLMVRLYLRKSGYDRPLINDTNRINELYKLVESERTIDQSSTWFGAVESLKSIMIGVESNVACWRAAHLEVSSYTKLMRSYSSEIDQKLAVEAYGHHSAHRTLVPGYHLAELATDFTGVHRVTPPPGVDRCYSVYRYGTPIADEIPNAGRFVSGGNQTSNTTKLTASVVLLKGGVTAFGFRPGMAEIFPSMVGTYWGRTYDIPTLSSVRFYGGELRFYKAMKTVGDVPMVWVDVTGSSDYTLTFEYSGVDNTEIFYNVQWHIDLGTWSVCVDTADRHGSQVVNLDTSAGDSSMSLLEYFQTIDINDNIVVNGTLPRIPPRKLEVFTTHARLIEGLDFYINDTTYSIVFCGVKPWRSANGNIATITCRTHGMIGPTFTRDKREEVGFVKNGVISANNRYDIRDAKPYRLYVDGLLMNVDYLRDTTIEAVKEIIMEDPNPNYFFAPELSGKPYCFAYSAYNIPELPEPLNNHDMREADYVKDQQISDYLTVRFPQPELTTPLYAAAPYELFSPFMFKILMAMKTNVIEIADYSPLPTDGQMEVVVDSFKWLLDYDPCRKNNEWWKGFVVIKAHPFVDRVQVTPAQRAFLLRINTFYLQGKIDVNNAIEII